MEHRSAGVPVTSTPEVAAALAESGKITCSLDSPLSLHTHHLPPYTLILKFFLPTSTSFPSLQTLHILHLLLPTHTLHHPSSNHYPLPLLHPITIIPLPSLHTPHLFHPYTHLTSSILTHTSPSSSLHTPHLPSLQNDLLYGHISSLHPHLPLVHTLILMHSIRISYLCLAWPIRGGLLVVY